MKLYQTPGGTWAGSEAGYKAAMKAEGSDPKAQTRKQVDVPVSKPELMEFLTFHNVNVVNPPERHAQATEVTGDEMPPSTPPSSPVAPTPATTMLSLLDAFEAAPIRVQLDLAVAAIDRANTQLAG